MNLNHSLETEPLQDLGGTVELGEAKVIPRRKAMHKVTKPTTWRKTAMDRKSDQWPQTCEVILGKLPGVMGANGATRGSPYFQAFPPAT